VAGRFRDRRTPGLHTFAFSKVTSLVSCEAGHWQAMVNPEWTIGGKPNGGYLLAMLARAAGHDDEPGAVEPITTSPTAESPPPT
jgi:hypothetical protein